MLIHGSIGSWHETKHYRDMHFAHEHLLVTTFSYLVTFGIAGGLRGKFFTDE